MKKVLSFAVAALCIFAVCSCKNAKKEAAENEPAAEEVAAAAAEEVAAAAAAAGVDEATVERAFEEIVPVEAPDMEDAVNYALVDVKPVFQGGDEKAFQKWIAENLQYPQDAIDNNAAGTVLAKFTVDKEGKIGDVKIIRGVWPSLDAEAVRVLEAAPDWTAGTQGGQPVNVSYVLPIKFQLK
ncbi:MAG: energy transducer TonB [Bacteroidales bacterium]|nr:energy transducer TonB [Bacteroidales bacterium]MBR5056250.1 energy transducer TonB [Bacteroidales bacterium]